MPGTEGAPATRSPPGSPPGAPPGPGAGPATHVRRRAVRARAGASSTPSTPYVHHAGHGGRAGAEPGCGPTHPPDSRANPGAESTHVRRRAVRARAGVSSVPSTPYVHRAGHGGHAGGRARALAPPPPGGAALGAHVRIQEQNPATRGPTCAPSACGRWPVTLTPRVARGAHASHRRSGSSAPKGAP